MKTKALFCTLIVGAGALAHDLYLMPGTFFPTMGSTTTIGFHVGDSFPESEVGGRLAKLKNAKLAWEGGSAAVTKLRVEGKRDAGDATVGGAGHIVASVQTIPTLIELKPEKFAEYLKEEGLTEVIEWRKQHGETSKPGKERYSKYAKSILLSGAANEFYKHSAGFVIEILPESDPYSVKPGGSLPVQVLFRGKPAADLQIETAWAAKEGKKTTVVGRTGPDGRFSVPVTAVGLWRIHTIRMERCAEPAIADWESFWASLTFEVKK